MEYEYCSVHDDHELSSPCVFVCDAELRHSHTQDQIHFFSARNTLHRRQRRHHIPYLLIIMPDRGMGVHHRGQYHRRGEGRDFYVSCLSTQEIDYGKALLSPEIVILTPSSETFELSQAMKPSSRIIEIKQMEDVACGVPKEMCHCAGIRDAVNRSRFL